MKLVSKHGKFLLRKKVAYFLPFGGHVLKKRVNITTLCNLNYKLGKLTFYRGHSIYQYYNDSLPTP